jgi:hypothetical protein
MKGVVVEIDNAKCIVLFNNGNIGSLPKPPNCEVGMVITVNFNRKIMLLPVAALIVLLAAGMIVWLALRGQGMSPERFCNRPFLRDDIILPLREYAGFDGLLAHLGNPVREFSPDHAGRFDNKRRDHDDGYGDDGRFYGYSRNARSRMRVFNYRYYSIVTYYAQDSGKVFVPEIVLNSKDVIYNGNFSIGDDRTKIENIFNKYIKGHSGSFSGIGRNMRFTMNDKELLFIFNGRNQLSGIRIALRPVARH